jgi:hypothetical protein
LQDLITKLDHIPIPYLFSPLRFDLAIHRHLTLVNQQFRVGARINQSFELEHFIKRDGVLGKFNDSHL